jgi:predicted esterase
VTGATLQRPHVWLPGPGGPPLLLLHGTGDDEHDMLPMRGRLAPDAPVRSPRGMVLVAVVNGRRDPMATAARTATLVAQLLDRGAEVVEIPHDGGHGIDPAVLPDLREFLAAGH